MSGTHTAARIPAPSTSATRTRVPAPARPGSAGPFLPDAAAPARPAAERCAPSRPADTVVASAAPAESPAVTRDEQAVTAVDVPWSVVVWDDPVNLMSYVVYVFRAHFGYPEAKARTLMLEVHHQGRSTVFTGSLEEAEAHVSALHGYGLWATYEKAGEN